MPALLDSQAQAFQSLCTLKVGALFMEPGTGKTRAAMELVKSVPVNECDLVLWLTPFSTKENLMAEITSQGGLDREMQIFGIETLSSSDRTYLGLTNLLETRKAFIVLDESLKIKNWDAIRTKRIIALGQRVEYKLILNGTPMTKDLLDLWAQMEFLSPKILRMDLAEFKNTFCEWVRITKTTGRHKQVTEFIKDYHNIDFLHSLIDPYVFRYDLRLNVGKQYHSSPYDFSDEEREEYAKLKGWFLNSENLEKMNNQFFLQMTQKMQHSYCCAEDKSRAVKYILKQRDANKTLIYCKYLDSLAHVEKDFPDCKALTYGKHSYGLNLQEYNTIIFWDKTFDYAQRVQGEHRIFRQGQTSDCAYYDLTGNNGLEKMINTNIGRKTSLLEYFRGKTAAQVGAEL